MDMVAGTFLDKTIDDIAKDVAPRITVLGIGGGGCNIVSGIKDGVDGVRVLALNSDAQHLSITRADERMLLGFETTKGLGCGGSPDQGALAAEESASEIEGAIAGSDLIVLTTTLGGGTGTGAAPVVARIAKELGILTIGVVTIPLDVEGTRLRNAREGLKSLVDICDSVVVIDNNRLMKVAGSLPLKDAFGVANERLGSFIRNLSEALSTPSLVNLDFADVKAVMEDGCICAVGFGEGSGDMKVEEAAERSLDSQLLDIGDVRKARGVLLHIEGGEDMTLEDVNRAGELILKRSSPDAKVVWGARINPSLKDKIRATVVLAGVESPFLQNGEKKPKKQEKNRAQAKSSPKSSPKKKSKKTSKKRKKSSKRSA